MNSSEIGQVVGTIFIALCAGLSDEGADLAAEIIERHALNAKTNPRVARVLAAIASVARDDEQISFGGAA